MDEMALVADDELARTRVRFLTAETVPADTVRPTILASWRRSREFQVEADRIDPLYLGDQNLDIPLMRGAEPVLEKLGEQFEGQPISLILTDPGGVVLTQRTGDADLARHLERVELVPGFSYGEQSVGTNGIGTALEDGRPTTVFGHEHYAEHLENLACAGVPIHHPISGKKVGAVDLTCWYKDAGGLLVALARSTAEQIRQALLRHSDLREMLLFQAYLQTCRRWTGIVLAFNEDIVMMNDRARQLLDPADQSVLLGHATEALAEGRRTPATLSLSSGLRVRVLCRRVAGRREAETAGGVLSVKLIEAEETLAVPTPMLPMYLPGVVGSAPLWLRSGHDLDSGHQRGEWVALEGEPGTGKLTLAKGLHQRHHPAARLRTVDAASGPDWAALPREHAEAPIRTLVIRHADRLAAPAATALAAVLRTLREDASPPWVVVTLVPEAETEPALAELLKFFPRTVRVPPLRHHVEDLAELVPLVLSKLGYGGRLTCSAAALHLLMRAEWPGNTGQLHQVLRTVAQRRRAGTIRPGDLPAEFHAVTRRPLNRFESIERDAIVRCLEDADGNKVRAAKLLGISRATIYRKIHEYGIVPPAR
ncbi:MULTISPECIES: helix-turn-helix domain-containing protein [unclassified Amycolatopsis]|uniref:sigma-54-dependent Fis family transcriptional regulator n=1 Tax=unclassified Amycolatopsis TaxID=2618356 RepID=UPI00287427E8|nr:MULTISPECIES: helix-turn-helix domain-containing protein [unclassified Amycolatopsis]MDS0139057.1 GAF domain-containing protein [Amycolatopsis sp. 505]MDS0147729.1 GAF domain-containing protein [Amycolatopsis sp. CM201R]